MYENKLIYMVLKIWTNTLGRMKYICIYEHSRVWSVLQQEDCGHIVGLVPTVEPTLVLTFSLVDIWRTCGTQGSKV